MLPPRQRGFLLFLSTLPDLALYARKVWSLTKASIGLMIWKKASYLLVRSSRLKILLTLLKQLKKTITKLIKLGLALSLLRRKDSACREHLQFCTSSSAHHQLNQRLNGSIRLTKPGMWSVVELDSRGRLRRMRDTLGLCETGVDDSGSTESKFLTRSKATGFVPGLEGLMLSCCGGWRSW